MYIYCYCYVYIYIHYIYIDIGMYGYTYIDGENRFEKFSVVYWILLASFVFFT